MPGRDPCHSLGYRQKQQECACLLPLCAYLSLKMCARWLRKQFVLEATGGGRPVVRRSRRTRKNECFALGVCRYKVPVCALYWWVFKGDE